MFFSRGEDPPTEDDIDYFGLYDSCLETRGNFAVFKDGEYAAKGRVGTTPLYWNRDERIFSFVPMESLVEFPDACLYNVKQNRLVCWDPMYYDKPMPSKINDAVHRLTRLLNDAVEFRLEKCDALLLSKGSGARLVDKFISDEEEFPSYTAAFCPGERGEELVPRQNRTIVYYDDEEADDMYVLARHLKNTTSHRKFLCGLGCAELFSNSDTFRPYVNHVVDHFTKFGLEVYSPFFDSKVMEYVLDMTRPEDRPTILEILLGDDLSQKDEEKKRKKWWFYW